MSATLSIIGAGGHGRVIADSAAQMACWDTIQFYDDLATGALPGSKWEVVATIEAALLHPMSTGHSAVVGIGDNRLRLSIQKQLILAGWHIATIIHPSAVISSGASVESGTVVMANAVVNIGATVGTACILNTHSSIDHDCALGAGVHISPGATLAGGVNVGDRCWIGAGATLIQGVSVGEDTIVGAGANVIRSLAANVTSVGNPAKIIKTS